MAETTNWVGARTEGLVMAALLRAGKNVLLPFGVQRYDLVIEDNGSFFRVQCKTAQFVRGAMVFDACGRHSRTGKRTSYLGEIEFFGVYLAHNEQCYLIPISRVPGLRGQFRVDAPRNNQVSGVTFASEFLIDRGALTQVAEGAGCDPVSY